MLDTLIDIQNTFSLDTDRNKFRRIFPHIVYKNVVLI